MEYYKNLDLADIKYFCDYDFMWKIEIWRDVIDFDSYQVSDLGRVKSLSKKTNSVFSNTGFRITKQKILKQRKDKDFYLLVNLRRNNKQFTLKSHRLVAICFIKNTKNKPEVNHKNFITTCNYYKNLEWNTSKENTKHRLIRYFKNKEKLKNKPCHKK